MVEKQRARFNVFYVLLVITGTLFAITAFAYFVMAARARTALITETSGLMATLDRQGGVILGVELALLAACTMGAMAWDSYFDRPLPDSDKADQPDSQS